MNYIEEPTLFDCRGETLMGILAIPEVPASRGVVLIVGGPQYRAGSHRQFVLLSRALAQAGCAVLRFDYRGMGDSTGDQQDFQEVDADISAAIDAIQHRLPQISRVVLWGLCDAASAALLYCGQTHDKRVQGLCLLNPWVRSAAGLARTHVKHYYLQRLTQKEFWQKLIQGKVAIKALTDLARSIRLIFQSASMGGNDTPSNQASEPPFQKRMVLGALSFTGPVLLILSGDDYTAKEFLAHTDTDHLWKTFMQQPRITRQDLAGVDHTFSNAQARLCVETMTVQWLARHVAD